MSGAFGSRRTQSVASSEPIIWRDVTIKNVMATDQTDVSVRVYLSSLNFDFVAYPDKSKIRFSYNSVTVPHWVEEWDAGNETAKIWIKPPTIPATGTLVVAMQYGGKDFAEDPANVFLYWNALNTQADIDSMTGWGTHTTSVVSDPLAPSPNGNVVRIYSSGSDGVFYGAGTALPDEYVLELDERDEASSPSAIGWGALVPGFSDGNNWVKSAAGDYNTTTTSANNTRNYTSGVGANTNYEVIPANQIERDYFTKFLASWKNKRSWNYGTHFSTPELVDAPTNEYQACCYDSANDKVIVATHTRIGRYSEAGVYEEHIDNVYGGTSWGGSCIKDGLLYMLLYGGEADVRVYTFDPLDLGAGGTQVANVSAYYGGARGANGLVWDGSNWLIGDSGAAPNVLSLFYVSAFNPSWDKVGEVPVSRPHRISPDSAERYGIQGLELIDNYLYIVWHETPAIKALWSPKALKIDPINEIADVEGVYGSQAASWDQGRSLFYYPSRKDEVIYRVTEQTESVPGTEFSFRGPSMGISGRFNATKPTPHYPAVGSYRQARMCNFFARKTSDFEPYSTVGAENIGA